MHLEAVARAERLDLRRMLTRAVFLGSHREVVFAVLHRTVDVGLTTRAWAETFGLSFPPLAVESYGLFVRATPTRA